MTTKCQRLVYSKNLFRLRSIRAKHQGQSRRRPITARISQEQGSTRYQRLRHGTNKMKRSTNVGILASHRGSQQEQRLRFNRSEEMQAQDLKLTRRVNWSFCRQFQESLVSQSKYRERFNLELGFKISFVHSNAERVTVMQEAAAQSTTTPGPDYKI